jgi:linearmycin/streptolysin S transport system permease protein
MFGLMACSTTLLQEKDQGTLRRLLCSPAPRTAVPLGKFLFCFVVGLVQMLLLFSFGELVFHVGTFRHPLSLVVLAISWSACATSFGMLIATWAKSQKQAEGLSTLLILVMAALGGCWFPVQIANLPWFAAGIMKCTLTWWAMTGFQGMYWHSYPLTHPTMLLSLGVQWAFALGGGYVALRLFHRSYLAG